MSWYVARQSRGRLFHHLLWCARTGREPRPAPSPRGHLRRGRRPRRDGGRARGRHRGLSGRSSGRRPRWPRCIRRWTSSARSSRPSRSASARCGRRSRPGRSCTRAWPSRSAPTSGSPRPGRAVAGIGGGTGSVRPDPEGEHPVIWQEVEALAATRARGRPPRARAGARSSPRRGRMHRGHAVPLAGARRGELGVRPPQVAVGRRPSSITAGSTSRPRWARR